MDRTSRRKVENWSVPLAALCVGWLIGHQPDLSMSSAVAANGKGMTPLERLLVQDEIRQNLVLYGLYADGDGTGGEPRNLRKLADTLMTVDVVSEIHTVRGGPPLILTGRERVASTPPEVDPEFARTIGGRHYLVETVFDEVTPTVVRTRTPAVYFDATKNLVGAACPKNGDDACRQKPVKTVMWVYHMTWSKTPQGWQISKNVLRDDN